MNAPAPGLIGLHVDDAQRASQILGYKTRVLTVEEAKNLDIESGRATLLVDGNKRVIKVYEG